MSFPSPRRQQTGPVTTTTTTTITTTITTNTSTVKEPSRETSSRIKRDKLLESLRQVELAVRRAKEIAMKSTKERVVDKEEEREKKEKRRKENKDGEKQGNNINHEKLNNGREVEKKVDEGGGGSHVRTRTMKDKNNDAVEKEDDDDDDLEEASEVPDELNRGASRTFLWLLQRNEEDPEKKDERLVLRLQRLEEERVRILCEGYPYSFTQWTEKKCEVLVQENEERREEDALKEQSQEKEEYARKNTKKFRKQRKFLRAKELMQRGVEEGNKEATQEEGEEQVTIKKGEESTGGKRKQMEKTNIIAEKERKKLKEEEKLHLEMEEERLMEEEEEERVTREIGKKRKTKEVKKKSKMERTFQKGVEKEVEEDEMEVEQEKKKNKFQKLEIREENGRITRHDPEEGEGLLMMEDKDEMEVEKVMVFREAERERTCNESSRALQESASGWLLVDGARHRGHLGELQHMPCSVVQAAPVNRVSLLNATTEEVPHLRSPVVVGARRTCDQPTLLAARNVALQVFVMGLPQGTTPQQLRVALEQFGSVADVSQPRGRQFAFVSFEEEEGKKAALQAGAMMLPGGQASIKPYRTPQDRMSGVRGNASFPYRTMFRGGAPQGPVTVTRGLPRRVLSPVLQPGSCWDGGTNWGVCGGASLRPFRNPRGRASGTLWWWW